MELGQVGGQGRVIEPPAVEPGVELAEGAGVRPAGVVAQRGVDQAARGRRGAADGRLGRRDLDERILHHNGPRPAALNVISRCRRLRSPAGIPSGTGLGVSTQRKR